MGLQRFYIALKIIGISERVKENIVWFTVEQMRFKTRINSNRTVDAFCSVANGNIIYINRLSAKGTDEVMKRRGAIA